MFCAEDGVRDGGSRDEEEEGWRGTREGQNEQRLEVRKKKGSKRRNTQTG